MKPGAPIVGRATLIMNRAAPIVGRGAPIGVRGAPIADRNAPIGVRRASIGAAVLFGGGFYLTDGVIRAPRMVLSHRGLAGRGPHLGGGSCGVGKL
jgi:hypothetical protein